MSELILDPPPDLRVTDIELSWIPADESKDAFIERAAAAVSSAAGTIAYYRLRVASAITAGVDHLSNRDFEKFTFTFSVSPTGVVREIVVSGTKASTERLRKQFMEIMQ